VGVSLFYFVFVLLLCCSASFLLRPLVPVVVPVPVVAIGIAATAGCKWFFFFFVFLLVSIGHNHGGRDSSNSKLPWHWHWYWYECTHGSGIAIEWETAKYYQGRVGVGSQPPLIDEATAFIEPRVEPTSSSDRVDLDQYFVIGDVAALVTSCQCIELSFIG
jgi:hypothetical protein